MCAHKPGWRGRSWSLCPISTCQAAATPCALLALGTNFPLAHTPPAQLQDGPEATVMVPWCQPLKQPPSVRSPSCWEGTARPRTWGGRDTGPLPRPPQAEPTVSWERSYCCGAAAARLPAGIAASQPCAGFDPCETWDLSPSLSCAFKETPLFFFFLSHFCCFLSSQRVFNERREHPFLQLFQYKTNKAAFKMTIPCVAFSPSTECTEMGKTN